jgi:hypothetical protein
MVVYLLHYILVGGRQWFCDDSNKVRAIKSMTMGEVSTIVQNCVTSFMDDI